MFAHAVLLTLLSLAGQDLSSGKEQAAQLPDVVVQGLIPEDVAREFIDQVAAPPRGAPVARWNTPVCVGVVNLRPETARFLTDRVADVARDVGVEAEEPGCSPDVVVVATVDADSVAQGLVERRRRILAPGNSIQSRSRSDLEAFANTRRPVRWWHISTAVDPATGRSVVRDPSSDNFNSNDREEFLENVSSFQGAQSLIRSGVRQDLRRAVVIVDFDELGDVDFNQLADYVAFVALAQVDPEADTSSFSTILNVFDNPGATPGLTEWDRSYLWGLYNSDDTAQGNSGREAALRREMLRAREREQATPTD